MSVIVKGMKMPSCCSECELNYDSLGCSAIQNDSAFDRPGFDMDTERLTNCPLRPLPEKHGRLIDADAYIEMMKKECDESAMLDEVILKVCRGGIKSMSTIVEAEGD